MKDKIVGITVICLVIVGLLFAAYRVGIGSPYIDQDHYFDASDGKYWIHTFIWKNGEVIYRNSQEAGPAELFEIEKAARNEAELFIYTGK